MKVDLYKPDSVCVAALLLEHLSDQHTQVLYSVCSVQCTLTKLSAFMSGMDNFVKQLAEIQKFMVEYWTREGTGAS